jgi:hypothetical protein
MASLPCPVDSGVIVGGSPTRSPAPTRYLPTATLRESRQRIRTDRILIEHDAAELGSAPFDPSRSRYPVFVPGECLC